MDDLSKFLASNLLHTQEQMSRYFRVDSTLSIHPIQSVILDASYQQNLTRLNLSSLMLSLICACLGLLIITIIVS